MKNHPVVLFDGVCNFCNGSINFLLKLDRRNVFRFAPLQSQAGQQLLAQYNLPRASFDSLILIDEGKVYQRSTAALRLAGKLPWYWQWSRIFWILPVPVRDAVYDLIAKNRYWLFGKKEACMIPTPEVRSRFL